MFKLSRLIEKSKARQSSDKQLLVSNSPPADEEEAVIRRALVDAQNIEKELESKLQRLDIPTPSSSRSEVNQFKQTISRLQSTHETTLSHTRKLSAQRRLPVEVLMLIFNLANDPYVFESWYRRPCVSSFRVSQVCRAWRNIALSMPELWTTVDLKIDNGATAVTSRFASALKATVKGTRNTKSTPYCDFVAELLRRSQQMDLNVFVYGRYYQCDYMVKHPVLRVLAPHLWRCSSLTIESMISTVESIFCSPGWTVSPLTLSADVNDPEPQKRTSRLRALKLDFFGWDEVDPRRVTISQEFPLLKHVELVGIRAESIFSLPLAQLHTFRQSSGASHYSTPRIHTLIPASPNLRTLKLAFHDYNSIELLVPAATSSTPLQAPKITVLELYISPDDSPSFGILTHINFSSLLELRVAAFPGDLLKEIIFVVTCLRPVGQLSLTKVAFRSEQMESGLLERFLELTPCLEELDIELPPPDDDDNNIECLVSKRLVPRLAVLTIHASSAKEISAAQGALCVIGGSRFAPRQPSMNSHQQEAAARKFTIVLSTLDEACNALMTLNMWHFKSTERQPFLRIAEWRLELSPLVDIITRADIPKSDRPHVARKLNSLMLEIESFRLSSGHDIANLFVS